MLEGNYRQTLKTLLDNVQVGVQPPKAWTRQRNGSPTSAPREDEFRRFARTYMLGEAICEVLPTLPAVARSHELLRIYTKDVSRAGIGFLSPRQLYPNERVVVWVPSGKLCCRVARCKKNHDGSFEVGATFDRQFHADPPPPLSTPA